MYRSFLLYKNVWQKKAVMHAVKTDWEKVFGRLESFAKKHDDQFLCGDVSKTFFDVFK